MNIQEIEEIEFNAGRMTEAQNCLAEAMPAAIARRGEIRHIGTGDFIIRVQHAVYCRATDGFAGMITTEVRHFETSEAGLQWWADKGEPEDRDDDESHTFEGEFRNVTLPWNECSVADTLAPETDEIPF